MVKYKSKAKASTTPYQFGTLNITTVGENITATTKIRNNYVAI